MGRSGAIGTLVRGSAGTARRRTSLVAAVTVAGGMALVSSTGAAVAAPKPTVSVVASGLNNPRGLAVGPEGEIYVAEAGKGGETCLSGGPDGAICLGTSGSVTRIEKGRVTRIVSGLISGAGHDGSGAEGPVAVSVSGEKKITALIGANTSVLPPAGLDAPLLALARAQLGQVLDVKPKGTFRAVAGVGDFDFTWSDQHRSLNPQFPDSNPNGVLAVGGKRYVADAGSNTLDEVSEDGKIKVLAYFPVPADAPADSVPTCVAKGPDGALYVGELLGGYYEPGKARVWRIKPNKAPEVWLTGFTTIQGCGFDKSGNFYATEFSLVGLAGGNDPQGALVKVSRQGVRQTLGTGQLFLPSGFAAGDDGAVYVSNWSILPGFTGPGGPTGQVVRITS